MGGDVHLPEMAGAVLAVAALGGRVLPEIVENVFPQAGGGVAVVGHGPQALLVLTGELFQGFFVKLLVLLAPGQEKPVQGHVLAAEQQKTLRGLAVPSGPSRLLVIAFQVFGHMIVYDETHIGLVNAHAESVGGHHHRGTVVEEILLVFLPLLVGEPGVVPGGGISPLLKGLTHLFHGLSGGAVDNPAFVPALLQKLKGFRQLVLGPAHFEIQVGPVKAGDGDHGVPQLQQGENVFPHPGSGSGGESGHHRPLGQGRYKFRNGQVAGPEVLAPLGDTVCLVDGDHGNGSAFGKVQEFRGQQPLRRHVDNLVHPRTCVAQRRLVLSPAQGAVQVGAPHPVLHQGHHLVLHQGDERGYHQGDALHQQGGHLVAHGFPRPRGHNPHRVPAGKQGVNQFLLPRAESGVAEIAFQYLEFRGHRHPLLFTWITRLKVYQKKVPWKSKSRFTR